MSTEKKIILCGYRNQPHECKHPSVRRLEGAAKEICPLCLQGQLVDSVELVASAVMELSNMDDDFNEQQNH